MNTEQTSKNIFTYKCRCECKELIDKGVCDKDLFEIQVIGSVNLINRAILVSIQTMKTVSAGKKWLINSLKNVLKMLKK